MSFSVKRKFQRFKITAPVIVELMPDETEEGTIVGSTRDVSAGGLYVASDEVATEGVRVRVHVDLSRVGELINTDGKVVRKDDWGFAIEFDVAHDVMNLSPDETH